MFKSESMFILGVRIYTSLEPGRKIHWNYDINKEGVIHSFFATSLQGALVHIIALKNDCEDMSIAACKLLGVST